MSRFWQDAVQVMEAATSSYGAGSATDLAVVVGASGGIHMVMQPGWSADGLRAHYGAQAVYQVTHTAQGVFRGRMRHRVELPFASPWNEASARTAPPPRRRSTP